MTTINPYVRAAQKATGARRTELKRQATEGKVRRERDKDQGGGRDKEQGGGKGKGQGGGKPKP